MIDELYEKCGVGDGSADCGGALYGCMYGFGSSSGFSWDVYVDVNGDGSSDGMGSLGGYWDDVYYEEYGFCVSSISNFSCTIFSYI